MIKNERSLQSLASTHLPVDDILHAIALVMARRQMELVWPTVQTDWPAIG